MEAFQVNIIVNVIYHVQCVCVRLCVRHQIPATRNEVIFIFGVSVCCNISGIRKVIHVKKGTQANSILVPVAFKNGTDIRSIKIIKPSALNKSPKILMAASNLLQEYKMKEKTNNAIYNEVISEEHYANGEYSYLMIGYNGVACRLSQTRLASRKTI